LQHFSEMNRFSPGRLPDLFAATKTISQNERFCGLLTNRREQNPLSKRRVMALRISDILLVVPVDVSLCTTITALYW
jgi:hypothetical protein